MNFTSNYLQNHIYHRIQILYFMWKEQFVKTDINAALFFKINVRMCHRIKFQIDQKFLILVLILFDKLVELIFNFY